MQDITRSKIPRRQEKLEKEKIFFKVCKGAFWGLLLSIACILAFALLIKNFGWQENVITAANQVFKVLSICAAAALSIKRLSSRRLLTGMLSAAMYILGGFLIFSLMQKSWGDMSLLGSDLVMSILIGLLTVLIANGFSKTK